MIEKLPDRDRQEKKYKLQTVTREKHGAQPLGEGRFGHVAISTVVTQLLRPHHDEYVVARERTNSGTYVTKTYTGEHAERNASRSVDNYQRLKDAGVKILPRVYRLSDADPRVVIASFIGAGKVLITSNTVPNAKDRVQSFDLHSFAAVLAKIDEEVERMSAQGIELEDPDAFFFETSPGGIQNATVEVVIGDFDAFTAGIDEEETRRNCVVQACKALFRLMMTQKIDPDPDKQLVNWATIASRIQVWASGYDVNAKEVYAEFIAELKQRTKEGA